MTTWHIATTNISSASYSFSRSSSISLEFSGPIINPDVVTQDRSGTITRINSLSEHTFNNGLYTHYSEAKETVSDISTALIEAGVGFNSSTSFSSRYIFIYTSDINTGRTTFASDTIFSSSIIIASAGGTTTSSGSTLVILSDTTTRETTYQLQNTQISTYTTTKTTTGESNSFYTFISASSTTTIIDDNTSLSISTFTTSLSSTLKTTSATTLTLNRISTYNDVMGTENNGFHYVTAIALDYNELFVLPKHTYFGYGFITDNFNTYGESTSYTLSLDYSFLQATTRSLATKTNSNKLIVIIDGFTFSGTSSEVSTNAFTQPISTSFSSGNNFSIETESSTIAISSFVKPYTRTSSNSSTTFIVTTTTLSTNSSTFSIIGTTYTINKTITNNSTYDVFASEDKGTGTFSTTQTTNNGYIIIDSTSMDIGNGILIPGALDIVHTGFSSLFTTSFSFTQDQTAKSHFHFYTAIETFQAAKNLQTTRESLDFSSGTLINIVNSIGFNVRQQLYQKSYSDTVFIHALPFFTDLVAGSHLSPDFPSEFVIPATYAIRNDGAVLPLPISGSTILTFLRNSTGGFGTSVHSNSYTTFNWSYSMESLSVTTKSTSLSEDNISTVTISSSTSTALHIDGNAHTIFDDYNNLNATKIFPFGGMQKITAATVAKSPYAIKGTVYPLDGLSHTYSDILTSFETYSISSETELSAEESIIFYHIKPGTTRLIHIITFARNLTSVS